MNGAASDVGKHLVGVERVPCCGETVSKFEWKFAGLSRVVLNPCACKRMEIEQDELEKWQRRYAEFRDFIDRNSSTPVLYEAARWDNVEGPAREAVELALKELPDYADGDLEGIFPATLLRRSLRMKGFVLVGDVGVGKSYAATAFLHAARERLVAGRMVSVVELAAEVRTYSTARTVDAVDKLKRYKTTPLLVLDDIDKIDGPAWILSMLYDLVNARYNACLPIIVTSNTGASELLKGPFAVNAATGVAIVDRLVEMCRWYQMPGGSRRWAP